VYTGVASQGKSAGVKQAISRYTVLVNMPVIRIGLPVLVVVLVASMTSCWYTKQAFHFLSERARAVPVKKITANPDVQAEVRLFLDNVDAIRRFAVDSLGLEASRNYTRYVTLERDYVADVVSACDSVSFKRHYWRYPIAGSLPYKGFYFEADAKREVERLKEAGLDVIARKVDAFSSLGYFTDPLYSFMASYDIDVIAELIFHESAHSTIFVKGADQFNEEFATFLGRKAAELFMESLYGKDSDQIKARRLRTADADTFTSYLKETGRLLELVYADDTLDPAAKLLKKATIISARALEYSTTSASMFTGEGYRKFDMGAVNNAYIDMYRLYEEDLGLFESWYRIIADESLPQFIITLKEAVKLEGKSIKDYMARRLRTPEK
jgi:predicted aminopeptidase